MKALSVLPLTVVSLSAWLYAADVRNDDVDYPDDYRKWSHVKSMVLQEAHPLYKTFGGIHHVYANSKALQALKAGKPYPDGSFLVFDLLEAKTELIVVTDWKKRQIDAK